MGKIVLAVFIFVLGTGIAGNTVKAQNIEDLDSLSARLDSVAMLYLMEIPEFESSISSDTPSFLYDSSFSYSDLSKAEIDLLKSRQGVLYSDYGVDLEAGLLQNLDQGVFGAEGIFYQRRAQVGVEWNVLKNGLFDNKSTIGQLENEIKIEQKRALAVSHQNVIDSKIDQLRAGFNRFRIDQLQKYLNILGEQKYALTFLYEQNYVTLDRVLDITSKLVKAESSISHYKRVNRYIGHSEQSGLTSQDYPVYNIDLDRLGSEGLKFYEELSSLNQGTDYKFYNELSLSTYLRYNLYGGTNPQSNFQSSSSREFFSAGVSLSLPIPLNNSAKRSVHEQKIKIQKLAFEEEKNDISNRLFERYRAYQAALQNYIKVHQNVVLQQDKIRMQQVKKTIGSDLYSPSELLTAISELYSLSIQILDVKEELYLRFFEIQSLIPDHSLSTYLVPFEINNSLYMSSPDYGFYMWSDIFQNTSSETLMRVLENEGIKTIYVSAGPGKEELGPIQDIIKTGSKNLEVHLTIGDPNLIFKDRYQKLSEHIVVADSIGATGIHLDVEPHTLDDWEENSEEYLQAFLDMITQVREWSGQKGLKLSISITADYRSIYNELESQVDKLVLMTYGSNDFKDYSQRYGKAIMEAPLGTALALRTGDFESVSAMEKLMEDIKEGFGAGDFFIHDYESWKQLKDN
ncbi:TolC family protein [Gracilimonas sp. Q87]|uniref:TolC family protein n=1 Tax=Gracilimonas sp. Q87 TaxID=3384766 RepID=UPI00398447EC